MKGRILVAGIGNIFLGDDAFGVEVVRALSRRALPGHVVVRDFGIRSYDLAYALMDDWDLVILVDAVPRGEAPGTLYTIQAELPDVTVQPAQLDAHSMDPVSVLRMVAALGGQPGQILVVGCEPATVSSESGGQMGLSEPVQAAVRESIRVIETLIENTRVTAA